MTIEEDKIEALRKRLWKYMVENNKSILQMARDLELSRHTLGHFLDNDQDTRLLTMARIQLYLEKNESGT